MTTHLELDLDRARAGLARLGELIDSLASVAALVRAIPVEPGLGQPGLAASPGGSLFAALSRTRCDELSEGIGRDAAELMGVHIDLRRYLEAVDTHERQTAADARALSSRLATALEPGSAGGRQR